MKFIKCLFAVAFYCIISISVNSQSVHVQIDFANEEFTNIKGDSLILPYFPYYVFLPHGAEIYNLYVFINDTELYGNNIHFVVLKQRETNEYDNSVNKQITFNTNTGSFPDPIPEYNDIIELKEPELQAGYLILGLLVCPFQYNPAGNKLNLLKQIELRIIYQIKNQDFVYETSEKNIQISKDYVKKIVLNPEDIGNMTPLMEKIDYSKIKMFDEIEDEEYLRNNENIIIPDKKPYHIRKIR